MGGSASTRKITIEHDDANGVIKISDTVVKRLRGEATQDKASDSARERPTAKSEDQRPRLENAPPLGPPPSSSGQSWRQSAASYEEMRNQAMRLNHERQADLKALEQKWRAKLAAAEDQNSEVQRKMGVEFTAAVDKVESLFPNQACDGVCQDRQQKVLECYRTNEKRSLQCSQHVKDFTNCVQQARMGALIKG